MDISQIKKLINITNYRTFFSYVNLSRRLAKYIDAWAWSVRGQGGSALKKKMFELLALLTSFDNDSDDSASKSWVCAGYACVIIIHEQSVNEQ